MTTGAQFIIETLLSYQTPRLYVYPGGTIAPLLDEAKRAGLAIFCARHEQGAGYAALAAARLCQQPQVVMVTSGPGVTNVITCIADAYYDSTPLVLIAGQVGSGDLSAGRPIRQRGFQEVDTPALLKTITKAQFQPTAPEQLAQVMADAFTIASQGRPGPVVIDLPMDLQRNELPVPTVVIPIKKIPQTLEGDLSSLCQQIAAARRPLIIAGQGVLLSGATSALRSLSALGIPVSHSLLGLGALPGDAELSLGFHGHTGHPCAGVAIQQADLLLVIGSRLDLRQTGNQFDRFAEKARIVRIDLDRDEVAESRIRHDQWINGDVKQLLDALLPMLEKVTLPDWQPWLKQVAEWKQQHLLKPMQNSGLLPQQVVEVADQISAGKTVICTTGVGSHQHWVARHFTFDVPQRRLLTSGGHGAMGYDLPSAIGAQLAHPDALVLCLVGDGSFQMNIQELAAIREYQLPIKIIVLDNHRLGLVSQFQQFNWQDDPTTGEKWNPDFAVIAQGYGIESHTISDTSQLKTVLTQALNSPRAALVHCQVAIEEDITPMLLAGQTLDQMWSAHE